MSQVSVSHKPFLVFGKPEISEEEIQAVVDVLRTGWIGTGSVAKEFENEFVKHMGGGYAVAVSSCTIGLVIALKACGIARGENVLTSPLTFAATTNAILMIGATPVFCDVDASGCLDVEKMFTSKSSISAILPVHYTGAPANMGKISKAADLVNIPVIEDAAHSFGGTCMGSKQGKSGDVSVFSFYATKNITSAEGGMIYTTDKVLAERCRVLSQQGQSAGAWGRYTAGPLQAYEVLMPGFKGNLPDVLAAIGLTQLKKWEELSEKRQKVWKVYEEAFGKKEVGHSRHLYTIRIKDRDSLRERLYDMGIGTGIHYTPLHLEPAYKYLGYKAGDFPMAEMIGKTTLSLPVSPTMSEKDALDVAKAVNLCKGE